MIINCDFNNPETTCPRCGYKAGGRDWLKNCPKASDSELTPPLLPLGDYLEKGLQTIGITPARVAAVLGSCGGCPERKAWLNRLGDWIARKAKGEAVDREIQDSGI